MCDILYWMKRVYLFEVISDFFEEMLENLKTQASFFSRDTDKM